MVVLKHFQRWLLVLLCFKALFFVYLILYGGIALGPDEAQYWTWSQMLDWGYYSKPPGIAWQIALGTFLLGNEELGVRILSVVISSLQAYLMFFVSKEMGLSEKGAFWSALTMALIPVGMLGSLFAITDGALLLFWTMGLYILFYSIRRNQFSPLALVVFGACIAGGALFKWSIYLLCPFFLYVCWLLYPRTAWSWFGAGCVLAFLGCVPPIVWNISHDWVTFRHVFATAAGRGAGGAAGNPFAFIGMQMLLLSPVVFVPCVVAIVVACKERWRGSSTAIAWMITVSIGGVLCMASCFQKIQGNWGVVMYPTAVLLACDVVFREHRSRVQRWFQGGVVASACLVGLALLLAPSWWGGQLFKYNVGWRELSDVLTKKGYDPEGSFLVSDKYQTTSILSFYLPGKQRAYFMNLQGARNNQYVYWPQLEEEWKGGTGYFVWVENAPHFERELQARRTAYQQQLARYFDRVEDMGYEALCRAGDRVAKGVLVFRCVGPRENLASLRFSSDY